MKIISKILVVCLAVLLVGSIFGLVGDPIENEVQIRTKREDSNSTVDINDDRVDFGMFEYSTDELDLDVVMEEGKTAIWVFYGDETKLGSIETNDVEFDWSEHGEFDEREFRVEVEEYGDVLEIDWGWNDLSGDIPTELGELENLERLVLQWSELSGNIPAEIGNLQNLKELDLSNNELEGEIPAEIGNLENLVELDLWDNNLEGEIPTEIGNLKNLEGLYLWYNDLEGEIPTEIGNLGNLKNLFLDNNDLTGEIPTEFGNLKDLEVLKIRRDGMPNEGLSGEIPAEIGNLQNLTQLDFWNNALSGDIPAEIGNLQNLEQLYLGRNELSGEIPAELGELKNLTDLRLHDNDLSGEIPVEISGLTEIERLYLQDNDLEGYEIGAFSTQPSLGDIEIGHDHEKVLDLSDNDLSSENVDNILSDLVESLTIEERASAEVDLRGNAAPSEEGMEYKETLEEEGWEIYVSDDEDTPGFTSLLFLSSAITATLIYKKKKE